MREKEEKQVKNPSFRSVRKQEKEGKKTDKHTIKKILNKKKKIKE